MTPPARNPETCEFRRGDSLQSDEAPPRCYCELARRASGPLADPACEVDASTCEACCRHPLPAGPRLNPVVASLIFAATDRALQQSNVKPEDRVRIHQVRQFAMEWLAVSGRSPLSPTANLVESQARSPEDGKVFAGGVKSPRSEPRIGLIGSYTGFGLTQQNLDISRYLAVDRWLAPKGSGPLPHVACRFDTVSRPMSRFEIQAWLDGLDAILFVEKPLVPGITSEARRLGVRVVCVPNWEWLHPGLDWLRDVELMLCPTRHTVRMMSKWKDRYRFDWEVEYQPWPVDVDRFRFRRRWFCRRFLYVHGSGGIRALDARGQPAGFRRKGFDILIAAARLAPEILIIAYISASAADAELPANIDLRQPPQENCNLYLDGDVCIQPSHWEGLGLPLLECQAAGLPLLTTDSPPMNEHRPLATIPISKQRAVHLSPELCIPAAMMDPQSLATAMRSVHGRFIGLASGRARRFVEREHNWQTAAPQILGRIRGLVSMP